MSNDDAQLPGVTDDPNDPKDEMRRAIFCTLGSLAQQLLLLDEPDEKKRAAQVERVLQEAYAQVNVDLDELWPPAAR